VPPRKKNTTVADRRVLARLDRLRIISIRIKVFYLLQVVCWFYSRNNYLKNIGCLLDFTSEHRCTTVIIMGDGKMEDAGELDQVEVDYDVNADNDSGDDSEEDVSEVRKC